MDTLKLKKEERIEQEDAMVALVNKAKEKALTEAEMKQLEDIKDVIEKLDNEIEVLEEAEAKAKEITKRWAKKDATALPGAPQDNASEEKELASIAKKFTLTKAFQNVTNRKENDGAEREVFQIAEAEAKENGQGLSGNIAIPQKFIKIGRRKLLDVATEGTDMVFTEYGGKVIPFLNPMPVSDQLGVTFLTGLRGDVQFPRVSGDVAFAWETENSDVNETTPTFNNIQLSPKRVGGYVDVSKQMLKQSITVLEPFLRSALNNRYALTVDDVIFDGAGSGNEPTGIFNYSGVNVLSLGSSGGDMTYAALLSMMRDTRAANSRSGSKGFVTNSYGVFALATTAKQTSGVEGNFIYNPGQGSLLGVKLVETNTISAAFSEGAQNDLCGIIYSDNWGGALLGTWGGLDILFDPYTQALGDKVRFVCNAYMDFEIEQAAEFSYCKDWDATDLPALT